MSRRGALLVAWIVALAGAGWALIQIGRGPLALPARTNLSSLRAWAAARDPATVVMCGLRLVTLVLDGYLLATTVAGAVARATRMPSVVRALDVLTPASVRRVLAVSMGGLVLSAPLIAPPGTTGAWRVAAAAPAAPPPPLLVAPGVIILGPVSDGPPLVRIAVGTQGRAPGVTRRGSAPNGAGPTSTSTTAGAAQPVSPTTGAAQTPSPTTGAAQTPSPTAGEAQPATASTNGVAVSSSDGAPEPGAGGGDTSAAATPASPWGTRAAVQESWDVHRGDNLWAISRRVLEQRNGRPMRASEIAPFWARLVRENLPRLRSGNANRIFEGERVLIPSG